MSEPIEKQDNAEAPEKSEEATVVDIEDISNLYEGTITTLEPKNVNWMYDHVWAIEIKSSEVHPERLIIAMVYADLKLGTPVLFSFQHQDTERTAVKHIWFKEDRVWTLDNKALAKAEEPEPQPPRLRMHNVVISGAEGPEPQSAWLRERQ